MSSFYAYVDTDAEPAALVCRIDDATVVSYRLRCLGDLYQMLLSHEGWVPLGIVDEKGRPPEGSVEAWARSNENPVGGWYGLRRHWRGRFAMYVPPLLEHLGYIELEHNLTDNRAKAPATRHPVADDRLERTLQEVYNRAFPEERVRYLELVGHDPVVGMAYLEGLALKQQQVEVEG